MAATDQQNILQQYQGTYQNPNFGGGPMPFNYKPPTAQQPQVMTGRAPWLPKAMPAGGAPATAGGAAAAGGAEPWYAQQATAEAAQPAAAPAAAPAAPAETARRWVDPPPMAGLEQPMTNSQWYAAMRPDSRFAPGLSFDEEYQRQLAEGLRGRDESDLYVNPPAWSEQYQQGRGYVNPARGDRGGD